MTFHKSAVTHVTMMLCLVMAVVTITQLQALSTGPRQPR